MSALVWVSGRAGDVGDERDLVTRQAPLSRCGRAG